MRPQDGMTADEFHRLREENARLLAENERLSKLCCVCEGDCCNAAQKRLAEVKRLEGWLEKVKKVRDDLALLAVRDDRDPAARAAWHRSVRLLDAALAAAEEE